MKYKHYLPILMKHQSEEGKRAILAVAKVDLPADLYEKLADIVYPFAKRLENWLYDCPGNDLLQIAVDYMSVSELKGTLDFIGYPMTNDFEPSEEFIGQYPNALVDFHNEGDLVLYWNEESMVLVKSYFERTRPAS